MATTKIVSVTLPVQLVLRVEILPGMTDNDIHLVAMARLKEALGWDISIYKENCEPESTRNALRTDFYVWHDNGKFADENRVG